MPSPIKLVLFLLALAAPASAHFVWLETTDAGPAAFFGEWSAGVRETQDGYLKIITAPQTVAADGALKPATMTHDRIALAAATTDGDPRLTAHYRPDQGETLIRYHARLGRRETAAVLPLELAPVAPDANAFVLTFDGQPLPATDVTLFSAEGWNRTFRTDATGRVAILTPWAGQYVLEVAHVADTPGEQDGRPHMKVRHVATLTFTVPAGA